MRSQKKIKPFFLRKSKLRSTSNFYKQARHVLILLRNVFLFCVQLIVIFNTTPVIWRKSKQRFEGNLSLKIYFTIWREKCIISRVDCNIKKNSFYLRFFFSNTLHSTAPSEDPQNGNLIQCLTPPSVMSLEIWNLFYLG